jgi:hypothetical protein
VRLVSRRRVQVLVAQDLSQSYQIVVVVCQVLMGHRVSQQVREQVEAEDGTVLVTDCPDSTIRKRPPFSDEHPLALHRGTNFQPRLNRPPGCNRQRDRPLLVAFAKPENDRARTITDHQVVQFQVRQVAHPTAGVQEQVEDRRRSDVLPQLDLPQEPADLAAFKALGCQLLPAKLFDCFGRVPGDVSLLDQPSEEPPERNEVSIHRGDGLAPVTSKVVLEISDVPRRDPADDKGFVVGPGEPSGKLPKVDDEAPAGAIGERNPLNRVASSGPTEMPSKTFSPNCS